jgi:hypothetical protein
MAFCFGVHGLLSLAIAQQVTQSVLVRETLVLVAQMAAELIHELEGLVAPVNALPPFAVRLQLVLKPLVSALVRSIWYLALIERTNLGQ